MNNIIIETERTLLREFNKDDYQAVFEFGSNKEVNKYTGDITLESPQHAKEIIEDVWFSDYQKYGYGRWAVIYKPDNKIIGFAGLKYLPEVDETDIGFRFLPAYWGKGIATEVSKEIIKYGFTKLNLTKIIGIAMPKNIASCRILEKIGLKFEKLDFYDKDNERFNWYSLNSTSYNQLKI
ncbi:MAG: GNAT family N-acetyltransferase [Bacteroidetes bacterium]|nr:MAG: GNAT family N-acetyltransferase [Bacteroidota bacterium]